ARIIVFLIGLTVTALNLVVPADYDIGVFYALAIAACAWTRSAKFLWSAVSVFVVLVYVDVIVGAPAQSSWIPVMVNRTLTALELLIVAGLVYNWMRDL